MRKKKLLNNKEGILLERIDSRELAYLMGFICADGSIEKNNSVEITVKLEDREIIEYLSSIIDSNISIDNTYIPKKGRYPRIRTKKNISDILQFTGGRLKDERRLPIISEALNQYLVRGFFDADGCITWGFRKDRGRVWQKVSFTSSYKMLINLQRILIKVGITTIIRPKKDERTFVMEIAERQNVLKLLKWIYQDESFIPLKRKFNNYNALRLELGELGETVSNNTIPSLASDLSDEGVETSGELNGTLNNHNSTQA